MNDHRTLEEMEAELAAFQQRFITLMREVREGLPRHRSSRMVSAEFKEIAAEKARLRMEIASEKEVAPKTRRRRAGSKRWYDGRNK